MAQDAVFPDFYRGFDTQILIAVHSCHTVSQVAGYKNKIRPCVDFNFLCQEMEYSYCIPLRVLQSSMMKAGYRILGVVVVAGGNKI